MLKLNLGSGTITKEGFDNLDLSGPIVTDLTKPLKYESNTVDYIYTEHFIEHIKYQECLNLFRECFRVLKPVTGYMFISTPNLNVIAHDYVLGKFNRGAPVGFLPASPCDYLNESMRSWGHQYLYDFPELKRILILAGFGDVRPAFYDETICYRPNLGDLFVTAHKIQ